MCGENHIRPVAGIPVAGSSPRVWGKLKALSDSFLSLRFIPTCVGKITMGAIRPLKVTVHPHVCGENAAGIDYGYLGDGSSPRVWGKCIVWNP